LEGCPEGVVELDCAGNPFDYTLKSESLKPGVNSLSELMLSVVDPTMVPATLYDDMTHNKTQCKCGNWARLYRQVTEFKGYPIIYYRDIKQILKVELPPKNQQKRDENN